VGHYTTQRRRVKWFEQREKEKAFCRLPKNPILPDNKTMSKTLHEIEEAIERLPLPERLQLYKDMPQLIGRSAEDLDWQRLGIENFFQDDSPDDKAYDSI
jgi:hypothetical protein